MQSARTPLSPSKENQLPSGKDLSIRSQNLQLAEILTYLKDKGIKLPSHLLLSKNSQDFSLKLKPVGGSTKDINQVKSLKIRLSDTEFQLKKIQQDFAQYKRAVKAEKDKEQKKFQEIISRLKEDSKQNNQDYDFILQRQNNENSQKMQKIRMQYCQKLEKLQKQLTQKHLTEISKLKNQAASEKESQQIQFNKQYENLKSQLTEEIQRLKQIFQNQKHNINQRHRQKLDQSQKNFQSTYLALQSQKKTQEKLHEKTKIETQKQKEKIFGQLCYERNVRKNLEDELNQRNKQIKQLKQKIQEISIIIELCKQNTQKQKQWIKDQHKKQIENIHQKYDAKIAMLLHSHTEACQKYESKIQKLGNLQLQAQKLHQTQLVDLSIKFDQRISKQQDLDEIKKLTDSLTRKQEQIKKLTRELRYRNLEIENKEEVYNKIFKSTARIRQQRKGLVSINKVEYPIQKLERDSWSKQSLFRKSQTADVRNLLGNICKTKRERTLPKEQGNI